jgi:hypothetical protein
MIIDLLCLHFFLPLCEFHAKVALTNSRMSTRLGGASGVNRVLQLPEDFPNVAKDQDWHG